MCERDYVITDINWSQLPESTIEWLINTNNIFRKIQWTQCNVTKTIPLITGPKSFFWHKHLIVPYYHSTVLHSQTAGLAVVPRIFKSRMRGRAFSFQAFFYGTSFQFEFTRQILSLLLRSGLNVPFW